MCTLTSREADPGTGLEFQGQNSSSWQVWLRKRQSPQPREAVLLEGALVQKNNIEIHLLKLKPKRKSHEGRNFAGEAQ